MGIPDLMRFVARDASGALQRICSDTVRVGFDYVLVDLTNTLQTLKLPRLIALLAEQVQAKIAIILVVDGQRHRQGTAREQRMFLQQRESDTAAQQLAAAVLSGGKHTSFPRIIVCGREIAGEGDYKLLSLHRRIVSASVRDGFSATPTMLLVSEDSDVLVGAMTGIAPHNVTIATTLHDALHDVHLLSVAAVNRRIYATSGLTVSASAFGTNTSGVTATAKKFDDEAEKSAPAARRYKVGPEQVQVQAAALDFVFLFALVLGSSTTPALTRGATRIDAAACWLHYSDIMSGKAKLRTGALIDKQSSVLRFSGENDADGASSVIVDAELLATILESRFADDRSRVPTADERRYAREYLKHLVESTVQLMVGAPSDSRQHAGKFEQPPSVSCLCSVLELHEERTYKVPFDFTLLPVSTAAGMRDAGETAEPVTRLAAFFDEATAKLIQPPLTPLFWPPHEARPVTIRLGESGASRMVAARVPVPLGASPAALNVPLSTLASFYAASIVPEVYHAVTYVRMDPSALVSNSAGDHAPRVGSQNLSFDFDLRRMVPSAGNAGPQASTREQILAAAGLSATYYDGAAAQEARRAWDAAGVARKKARAETKPATTETVTSVAPKATKPKKRLGKRERRLAAKKA